MSDEQYTPTLEDAMSDAKGKADVDGYGDEGAGYDFHVMVREFMDSEPFMAWLADVARRAKAEERERIAHRAAHAFPDERASTHVTIGQARHEAARIAKETP